MFGGLVPAAYKRAATHGQGWVAPLMGRQTLEDGAASVRQYWADAGRPGEPRIATGRYFSLGDRADARADKDIRHYYGDAGFAIALADTLTSPEQIRDDIDRLAATGVTDLLFYPCTADPDQVHLLADAAVTHPRATRPHATPH